MFSWRSVQTSAQQRAIDKPPPPDFTMARWHHAATLLVIFTIAEVVRVFPGGLPLMPGGDSTVFMNDARRLLEGQAMYRDFFQFTAPGASVVYWAMFRMFGVRAWVEDAGVLLLAVALVALTFAISRRIVSGWAALVAPSFVAGVTFRYYHDATHHWFSAVTIAASVAILIVDRTRARLITAGALCGVTAFFTQNKGAGLLVGIILFIFWESTPRKAVRRVAWLLGGTTAAFGMLMLPFLIQSGPRVVFDRTVVFAASHYSGVYANSRHAFMADWPSGIFPKFSYLLTYGSVLIGPVAVCIQARKTGADTAANAMLVAVTAITLFACTLPAAGGYRVAGIAFLGFVALCCFLQQAGRCGRALLALLAIASVSGIVIPARSSTRIVQLPVGTVACPETWAASIEWARSYTSAGDAFVGNPVLGFAMLYRMPSAVLYPSAGRYTTPGQYRELIAWAEDKRPRFIVLHPSAFLPVYDTQGSDTAGEFRLFLSKNYSSIGFLGDEEIFTLSDLTNVAIDRERRDGTGR